VLPRRGFGGVVGAEGMWISARTVSAAGDADAKVGFTRHLQGGVGLLGGVVMVARAWLIVASPMRASTCARR